MLQKDLEKYKNEYILISDGEVVAHSDDIVQILKTSEKYPQKNTRITRVLSGQANFF